MSMFKSDILATSQQKIKLTSQSFNVIDKLTHRHLFIFI